MTVYTADCGSHRGMMNHQANDEPPCGQCLIGEAGRRLYPELIPTRPTPPTYRPAPLDLDEDTVPTLRVVA